MHESGLCTKCRADGWTTGVGNIKRPWKPHIVKRYNTWKRWIGKKRAYCKKHHRMPESRASINVSKYIAVTVRAMAREDEERIDDIMLRLLRCDDLDNLFFKQEVAAVAPKGRNVGKGVGKKIYPWKTAL